MGENYQTVTGKVLVLEFCQTDFSFDTYQNLAPKSKFTTFLVPDTKLVSTLQ